MVRKRDCFQPYKIFVCPINNIPVIGISFGISSFYGVYRDSSWQKKSKLGAATWGGGTCVDLYITSNQIPPFRRVSSHLDSPVRFIMFELRFSKHNLTTLAWMLSLFFLNWWKSGSEYLQGSEKQLSASQSSVSLSEKTAQILPLILSSFHCFLLLLLRFFLLLFLFLRMKQLIAEKAVVFLSSALIQLRGFSASLKIKKAHVVTDIWVKFLIPNPSFQPISNADFIVPVEIDGTVHQVWKILPLHFIFLFILFFSFYWYTVLKKKFFSCWKQKQP